MNAQELIEYCKQYQDSIYVRSGNANVPISELTGKELLTLLARWAKREYKPAVLQVMVNKPVDRTEPKG